MSAAAVCMLEVCFWSFHCFQKNYLSPILSQTAESRFWEHRLWTSLKLCRLDLGPGISLLFEEFWSKTFHQEQQEFRQICPVDLEVWQPRRAEEDVLDFLGTFEMLLGQLDSLTQLELSWPVSVRYWKFADTACSIDSPRSGKTRRPKSSSDCRLHQGALSSPPRSKPPPLPTSPSPLDASSYSAHASPPASL